MAKVVNFLDIKVDNLTMQETLNFIENSINENKKIIREDINAAKIVWLQKDITIKNAIEGANIVNADGQSVVIASKLLKTPIKERVTGIDLMQNLVTLSHKKRWSIYLLGAKKDILKTILSKYSKEYSKELIAGFHDGYFTLDEEENIINDINKSKASILFIGISSPKKEEFINRNFTKLNVNLVMGVGGSFDVIAGKVKRAPIFLQKLGLEWVYRLYQEPKKMWRRYLYTNSYFIIMVLKRVIKN